MITRSKLYTRELSIKLLKLYLSKKRLFPSRGRLLILRLDSIGDYVLFRNFLKPIRESDRFKDFRITLCGNELWKDLALTYDHSYVDEFIWIDKSKFLKRSHWTYTYKKLLEIHSKGFEYLINPADVKNKMLEIIHCYSGTDKILVNVTEDQGGINERIKSLSNSNNVGLIHDEKPVLKNHFQFFTNRKFTESLIKAKTNVERLTFDIDITGGRSDYIVLFLGAGYHKRMWNPKKFAELCRLIRKKCDLRIILCGSNFDTKNAAIIMKTSGIDRIEDYTGRTTLPQLVNLIANSRLLISNETCSVHIAASVGTKAVCISNGNHFGKFNPYPEELAENIITIYPAEVTSRMEKYEELIREYEISSDLDIDQISAEEIFFASMKLL
ncbi:MAG: glycosyltransferase family 9 protein [Ignavibacteria bacterium]